MTTQPHGNNRPVAFTGKPTKSQFARHLSACPLVDHPLYVDYLAGRKVSTRGPDDFGGWLSKNYKGTFTVLYSKCLNDTSTWEAVWAA